MQVSWGDFEGHVGRGQTWPLGDQAGLFWFFRESNVEMLVKMVDGCTLTENPRFWLFVAATTSVNYTLTVTGSFSTFQPVIHVSASDDTPPFGDTIVTADLDSFSTTTIVFDVTMARASSLTFVDDVFAFVVMGPI